MENEIRDKRGLIFILIIASGAVFIGLVWIIATYFPWNRLGLSESGNITRTPRVEVNCTYPITYWMEHSELYPAQVILGSQVYQANDIRKALSNADQGLVEQLQAQLVVAFLNTSAGADQDIIETTIFQAYKWLVEHPDGSQIVDSDRETGLRYLSILEAYNLGLAGVPVCEGVINPTSQQTTTSSYTPTLFLTHTPSQTPTPTPSETASPTYARVTPIFTVSLPTKTPIPTTEAPVGQVPTATRTLAPQPSNTPINTTEAPTPTEVTPTFPPIDITPTFPSP